MLSKRCLKQDKNTFAYKTAYPSQLMLNLQEIKISLILSTVCTDGACSLCV